MIRAKSTEAKSPGVEVKTPGILYIRAQNPEVVFPANDDVPNAFGVTRRQAAGDMMPCFEAMAKALNNISIELAGPSSNPGSAAEIAKVRAIFERHALTEPRIRAAMALLREAWDQEET